MIDPELTEGYIGPNKSHQAFKRDIVANEVLVYLLTANRKELQQAFTKRIDEVRSKAGERFSIGLVTEQLSPTQMRALNIPHNEARLIAEDFDHLETQLYSRIFSDVHRCLETYLIELFMEIARADPRVLISEKAVTFEEVLNATDIVDLLVRKQLRSLTRDREEIGQLFNRLGLTIIPPPGLPVNEQAFIEEEYTTLWAVRNVLEHAHGVADEKLVRQCPNGGFQLGMLVRIDLRRLGRALAAAQGVANNLNKRAVVKYSLPKNPEVAG